MRVRTTTRGKRMGRIEDRRRQLVLALAALAAGCGGSDSPAPSAGPSPSPSPSPSPGPDDSTAPTCVLTAPADLADGITGVLALAADASDDTGVEAVEFQIDGITLAIATGAPYTAGFDSATWASGQHVVRARARDAAGNVSAWSTATVRFGGARTQPAGFTRNTAWITGLSSATAFAQAPDGRLFVCEQGGHLRVVKAGALLATPFTTITVDASGERGLLGVALHPDFASNGYVYVYATRTEGGIHNRISRFTADGDVAGAGSELTLIDLPALSATNHNGGAIHFGPDGKLYAGVGENATPSRSQDLSDPFGKLLRMNDDGSAPADNPFYDTQSGLAQLIWAYGLRNPFTFAIDPATGRIHVNDVGQNTWEEINLGAAGANYGWPASEGPDGVTAGITGPIFTYKHADASPAGSGPGGFFTGFAIAGGAFYPESGPFPDGYRGQYYFADYASQWVGRLDMIDGNEAYAFAQLSANPVDMLVGADGALYVLTRGGITRISAP